MSTREKEMFLYNLSAQKFSKSLYKKISKAYILATSSWLENPPVDWKLNMTIRQ